MKIIFTKDYAGIKKGYIQTYENQHACGLIKSNVAELYDESKHKVKKKQPKPKKNK